MKQQNPNWITEAEAAKLAGFSSAKTFRRRVQEGDINVLYSKMNRKSEPRYNKNDIERLLLERSIQPAA